MSYQGLYDPNLFISGDFATYPMPAVGVYYQPGMYWEFSVGGTFDGTPVSAGDRTYVEGRARQYGDALYGDDLYGDPPGEDWPVYVTSWVLWFANQFPWLQNPPLSGGCPLVTGWRVHVEWLHDDRVTPDDGQFEWVDVSDQVTEVTLARGGTDGRQRVDVDRLRVVFVDRNATLLPMYPVATSSNFGPGDRVRVGMSDGTTYYPLMTCRVENVEDLHDEQPRLVAVNCFGHTMDLVVPLLGWSREVESAAARAEAIESAIEWNWSEFAYETTPGLILAGDAERPEDLIAREELDRTAISTGWSMRTGKRGGIEFVVAPYTGAGSFEVADCKGQTGVASPVVTLRDDLGELLNSAAAVTSWATDPWSGAWDYQTPQNPSVPGPGDCIHPRSGAADDTIRFHALDDAGNDWTALFLLLKPGDRITKETTEWTVVSSTDNGDSTFSVQVTPSGSPQGTTGVHRFFFGSSTSHHNPRIRRRSTGSGSAPELKGFRSPTSPPSPKPTWTPSPQLG